MSWRTALRVGPIALALMVMSGCGAPPAEVDAGPGDAGGADAGVPDAGAVDAGAGDGGREDAGAPDAGAVDAGAPDAGPPDAGGLDAGAPDAGPPDAGVGPDGCLLPSGAGSPFRLRAIAANLTSGNFQSWDPGHGERILQGLQPDVVLIQEFNYDTNSSADVRAFVDRVCGASCAYVRGAGSIPNGVISRWPLRASGEWVDPRVGNRGFTWAHIDLPGPRDLWAVSLHLLTASAGERNLEAQALLARLDANIPATDLLLVGGDFNTENRSESCLSTLAPRVVTAGPHPVDQAGVEGTNRNRDKPYDQVLASRCLRKDQAPVAIGAQAFDAGLVFDSRVYVPLSDVPPVLQSDSAAAQMQHMAVVKDFVLQP